VIGQPSFSTNGVNQGGISASSLALTTTTSSGSLAALQAFITFDASGIYGWPMPETTGCCVSTRMSSEAPLRRGRRPISFSGKPILSPGHTIPGLEPADIIDLVHDSIRNRF